MKHLWIDIIFSEKTIWETISSFDLYYWLSLSWILLHFLWLWLRLWIIINKRTSHRFLLYCWLWLRLWLLRLIGIYNSVSCLIELLNIILHLITNLVKSLIDTTHSSK